MTHTDGKWFKSKRSPEGAACVEVQFTPGGVGVRDSKDPGGGSLSLTKAQWLDLIARVKTGDLDLPPVS